MEPRRIGLLGGESTGKSTLARQLADTLPALVAQEHLRDFVRDRGRMPAREDQEGIYRAQADAVARVTSQADLAGVPWVIADPVPLMTAVYSVIYFDDGSLLDEGIADASTYDVLLWCAPDIAWSAEAGMRDGADIRERTDRLIAVRVAPLLPLTRITGAHAQRLREAVCATA